MKNSRRLKRMARSKGKVPGLNLTSLMDVFTILVFFLLFNSSSSEVLQNPKEITLPDSVVETKPRETVVVFISEEVILVQGEPVAMTKEAIDSKGEIIKPVKDKLEAIKKNVIGISTKAVAESKEVTVLADKKVPFKLLKKVMTTCTSAGYGKISLAVLQKAKQG